MSIPGPTQIPIIDFYSEVRADTSKDRACSQVWLPAVESSLASSAFAVLLRRYGSPRGVRWRLIHKQGQHELGHLPDKIDSHLNKLHLGLCPAPPPWDTHITEPILNFSFGQSALFPLSPLHLTIVDTDAHKVCWMATAPHDRASNEMLKRLLLNFKNLLDASLRYPSKFGHELPLLGEDELAALDDWNNTRTAFPDIPAHVLIEQIVDKHPMAPAISFSGQTLSYSELDTQANYLARQLIEEGVREGTLVRLVLERGPNLIIAILAVLKAGGAWVPIDPSYPTQRVQWMFEDTPGPVVLTHPGFQSRLPPSDAVVIELPRVEPISGKAERAAVEVPSSQLAYAIFTSGSTGRPKAVTLEHRGLVNLIWHTARHFDLGPGRRLLQFSSASFDVSVWEIFAALSTGACLVLAESETLHDPKALAQLMKREHVDSAFWLASFMVELNSNDFPDLKLIVTGGDQFSQSLVNRWTEPGRRMIYVYGPTEAVVFQSWVECYQGTTLPPATIGLPMPNMRFHLLDEHDLPVPIGVMGELAIAGIALGREYLANPELTARKFSTLDTVGEARVYRSGDLAVRREDGQLDFLGRADQQVKIRGFRIELHEIEQTLISFTEIEQAAVIVHKTDRTTTLAAFVVLQSDASNCSPATLRERLSNILPDYMVPEQIIIRERLPHLPNGKVDRHTLKAEPLKYTTSGIAPRTDLEIQLHRLWVEVLGHDSFGIEDDFFTIGGQSLSAIRLINRLKSELAIDIQIRDLLAAETIAALGKQIECGEVNRTLITYTPSAGPLESDYPLSQNQRRLWLIDRLYPQARHIYNVAVSWMVNGPLDHHRLSEAFDTLIKRHEILRTRFVEIDGEPRQLVDTPEHHCGVLRYIKVPKISTEAEMDTMIQENALQSFTLESGPLIRVALNRLASQAHLLILTMPHLICDAWSLEVLIHELCAHYQGEYKTPLPFQYRDFARHQLEHDQLELVHNYWLKQLAKLPPPLDLPIDHPRQHPRLGKGKHHKFLLDGKAVATAVASTRSSDYAVNAAVLLLLLSRTCGANDVIFGSPVSGRESVEFEKQIGFYSRTLAIRHQLNPMHTFRELIISVWNTTLDAIEYGQLSFDALVELIGTSTPPGRHPLFDVWLTVQESGPRHFEFEPDVQAYRHDVDIPISLFDLSFQLERLDGTTIEGRLQYDSMLYEPSSAALLAERFTDLISRIPSLLDTPLKDIELDDTPTSNDPFSTLSFTF